MCSDTSIFCVQMKCVSVCANMWSSWTTKYSVGESHHYVLVKPSGIWLLHSFCLYIERGKWGWGTDRDQERVYVYCNINQTLCVSSPSWHLLPLHLRLHLWLPTLSLFSSHSSICPPIYSSFPTAISSSEPLCIPPLHHSLTQPVFLSLVLLQPGLSVSSFSHFLPVYLSIIWPQCYAVFHSLKQHHMCYVGQCWCVCAVMYFSGYSS